MAWTHGDFIVPHPVDGVDNEIVHILRTLNLRIVNQTAMREVFRRIPVEKKRMAGGESGPKAVIISSGTRLSRGWLPFRIPRETYPQAPFTPL